MVSSFLMSCDQLTSTVTRCVTAVPAITTLVPLKARVTYTCRRSVCQTSASRDTPNLLVIAVMAVMSTVVLLRAWSSPPPAG